MDTRLLHAFVVLAETEHFGEASSKLFISQPALTKQIKTLESQLGITLFQRGRYGAKLTPEGQYLLSQSQSVLREARVLEKQARQLSEPQKAELYAGFGLSSLNFITPLLAKFNHAHPDITVHIDDMPSSMMENKLRLGELDLAFSRLPVTEPLKGISLAQERLMLAIPTQNIMVLEIEDDPLHYFNILGLIQLVPEKGKNYINKLMIF